MYDDSTGVDDSTGINTEGFDENPKINIEDILGGTIFDDLLSKIGGDDNSQENESFFSGSSSTTYSEDDGFVSDGFVSDGFVSDGVAIDDNIINDEDDRELSFLQDSDQEVEQDEFIMKSKSGRYGGNDSENENDGRNFSNFDNNGNDSDNDEVRSINETSFYESDNELDFMDSSAKIPGRLISEQSTSAKISYDDEPEFMILNVNQELQSDELDSNSDEMNNNTFGGLANKIINKFCQ